MNRISGLSILLTIMDSLSSFLIKDGRKFRIKYLKRLNFNIELKLITPFFRLSISWSSFFRKWDLYWLKIIYSFWIKSRISLRKLKMKMIWRIRKRQNTFSKLMNYLSYKYKAWNLRLHQKESFQSTLKPPNWVYSTVIEDKTLYLYKMNYLMEVPHLSKYQTLNLILMRFIYHTINSQ